MADWTKKLIEYGDSRGWSLLPKKALRSFSAFSGGERITGFAADKALRAGYGALQDATPAERAACHDWQDVLSLQQRQREAWQSRQRKTREQRRAELLTLADQPGWLLLAGEDTAVFCRGTFAAVDDAWRAGKHLRCRRTDGGNAVWAIVAPDGREFDSGSL